LHSTPPFRGSPLEYCHPVWRGKTRMVALSGGGKTLRICITVYTQYRRVTDRQTDRHTSCHGIARAMHTRRAVKTLPLMSQTVAQFHSLVFFLRYCKQSLNIVPLALISLRVLMIGVSLCNPGNRLQLIILISPKPLTWCLARNCLEITLVWCPR